MGRKQKTIHYLYKTTCIITGRYYVGMHSTSNLDDAYMGSGLRLRRSIRKYGVNNHTKEIIKFLPTREMLIEAEKEIITPNMLDDDMCMNLKGGGNGGFISEEQQLRRAMAGVKARVERLKNDLEFRERYGEKRSEILKTQYDDGIRCGFSGTRFEEKHSDETKRKMSESSKGTGIGESNSQYGTCWITKDGLSKKIKKEDLEIYLCEEWVKGRK